MPEQAQESLEITLAAVLSLHQEAMPDARVEGSEDGALRITSSDRNDRLGAAQGPASTQRWK